MLKTLRILIYFLVTLLMLLAFLRLTYQNLEQVTSPRMAASTASMDRLNSMLEFAGRERLRISWREAKDAGSPRRSKRLDIASLPYSVRESLRLAIQRELDKFAADIRSERAPAKILHVSSDVCVFELGDDWAKSSEDSLKDATYYDELIYSPGAKSRTAKVPWNRFDHAIKPYVADFRTQLVADGLLRRWACRLVFNDRLDTWTVIVTLRT